MPLRRRPCVPEMTETFDIEYSSAYDVIYSEVELWDECDSAPGWKT